MLTMHMHIHLLKASCFCGCPCSAFAGTQSPIDEGGAALPVDISLSASACPTGAVPGARAFADFSVNIEVNGEYFTSVVLQVDFPTVLWDTGVTLTCANAAGQGACG